MGYLGFGIALILGTWAAGQPRDPAPGVLDQAYEALRARDYAGAIAAFRSALAAAPGRSSVHKDLAYVLLKTGENEAARDHFGEAARLDPADDQAALEYAFLCYETGRPVQARRVFDRLRRAAASAQDRETAETAFENIDRPLREGIARWRQVLDASPGNFSAHEELARLAQQRDELALAAEHYQAAWRLRPGRGDLLVELGRVWRDLERPQDSMAALLAASRGASARVAEEARELLPGRYPFPYEFERALELDPGNLELRRELAYLLLEMNDSAAAEQQFAAVLERAPQDLLSAAQLGFLRMNRGDQTGAALLEKVLSGGDAALADRVREALRLPPAARPRSGEPAPGDSAKAREMAERSLEKGYLKDALRYLQLAHEEDPLDFGVMLKLGWTYNNLKNDREAVRWFDLARRSTNPAIAAEAGRAYRNLAPGLARVRGSFWAFPMFSTRWHDAFAYAQARTELFPSWPVRPYLSIRFVGDARGRVNLGEGLGPQYLSERSAILALGLATRAWHGFSAWFEAGEAFRYRLLTGDTARLAPDYRGGISHVKGFGRLPGAEAPGWFAETNNDAVFVSRLGNDGFLYSQNRAGYTWGGFQLYWNWNLTADARRQNWANFAEAGPGVRFRIGAGAPMFTVNLIRGVYLMEQGGLRARIYNDVRVGIWYAR
jgi:Tfp pilus assembly protein PilF